MVMVRVGFKVTVFVVVSGGSADIMYRLASSGARLRPHRCRQHDKYSKNTTKRSTVDQLFCSSASILVRTARREVHTCTHARTSALQKKHRAARSL